MCDRDMEPGYGWRGWRQLPESAPPTPAGDWVDLSHPLSAAAPRVPSFPAPVFERVRSLPEDPLNVTRMEMVVHIGTHVDSPRHFFIDGPAFEDVPLDRLGGRGIVGHADLQGGDLVELRHLAHLDGRLSDGDILVLDTGWHRFAGSATYDNDHPALSLDAADWIIAQGVKMVAFDVPTPDLPVVRRAPGFDFPVHRRLLSHGVMIAEHLTNLAPLRDREVELFCGALNIAGADGAPARIVARPITPRAA